MSRADTLSSRLESCLRELRLPAFRDAYQEEARRAEAESLSYEQYLLELVQRECEDRRQHRVERNLRASRLPTDKTLSGFDLKRLPTKVRQQVQSLKDGAFLKRCENVLAFGNPGSGKTHLLCGLGRELIENGYRVHFAPCGLLVQDLLIAKRELKLTRVLKRLSKFDALILDDIGYVQQNREEMEVLFTLLAERYETGSVMITSNLPFSKWETIFKDPMTTAAAIDRLVHHSVILELNLPSYRMTTAKQRSQKEKEKKD